MTKKELAKELFKISHITGQFKLRSGKISNEYFDKYRFESQPQLLKAIAENLKTAIPTECDALAGLEMGGIPIATALSLQTGKPSLFVRKKAKEYGSCQFAEGFDVRGKELCIIEDVVTTGGQVIESVQQLRELGATVKAVLCVINRNEVEPDSFKEANLQLTSLFTMSELKNSSL